MNTVEGTQDYYHDSVHDQDKRLAEILKRITIESVDSLTRTLGFQTLSMKRLTNSLGSINVIFFICVRRLATEQRDGAAAAAEAEEDEVTATEWVLRVTNPWRMWTHHMQGNEAYLLNRIGEWNRLTVAGRNHSNVGSDERSDNDPYNLQDHCVIPVATVLSFSSDAQTSPLGCEYSLVTKMPGSNAEEVMDAFDTPKRRVMWGDWMGIVREMQSIPAEFMFSGAAVDPSECATYIGTFGSMGGDGGGVVGPFLRDGFPLRPARHQWQQEREALQRVVEGVPLCAALHRALPADDVEDYLGRARAFLSRLESGDLSYEELWPPYKKPYRLTHNDLNMGNILVDEATGHITAVLDWDRAHWGLHDDCVRAYGMRLLRRLFSDEREDDSHANKELGAPPALPASEVQVRLALLEECERDLTAVYPDCGGSDEVRIKWTDVVDSLTWVICICATWMGKYPVYEGGAVEDRGSALDDWTRDAWDQCQDKLVACGLKV